MKYTDKDIVDLLHNYKDLKKEEAIFCNGNEKLRFLEHCLKYLDDYERDIVLKTFTEGVSIRKYSLLSGFSRSFIARQREKSVTLLTKFFNVKFSI